MSVSPYSCQRFISTVTCAEHPIVSVRFWYQASHPSAVAVRGGAILMSMKRGVAPPAEDPERAILLQTIWCLVVTFETVGVRDVCVLARGKR